MFKKKRLENIEKLLINLEERVTGVEETILELIKSSTLEMKSMNVMGEEIANIYKVLRKALELQQEIQMHDIPKDQMN